MRKYCFLIYGVLCLFVANAQYTVLHNFGSVMGDGKSPYGSLTLSGKVLYGMTRYGGSRNYGSIFSVDTDGNNYKVLLSFDSINGLQPWGNLTLSGKVLYGMTSGGWATVSGTIFSIDTDGNNYKILLNLNSTIASGPLGSLTFFNGILYGMTISGGTYNQGCVFSVDTNGTGFKDLLDFNGSDGSYPQGSLILSGKVLYGMTTEDGVDGNIFSIDTNGDEYKDLYDFSGSPPPKFWPRGSLILSGSKLYGMASQGGGVGSIYVGNVFSIDTNGNNYTDLFDFANYDGASPYGSLTLSGSKLYGMTYLGGRSGYDGGDIFSIDTNGSRFKELYDFNFPTGADPWGDLTLSGNMLYGMTNLGGADSAGVVFSFNYITVGINNLIVSKGAINIYPNPSNGLFTFELNTPETGTIEIYDITGQKIYQQNVQSEKTEINLSGQPAGMYFYRAITNTGSLIGEGKVVMEK